MEVANYLHLHYSTISRLIKMTGETSKVKDLTPPVTPVEYRCGAVGSVFNGGTQPFGVPAVLSLAFWGGVWGILFALIHGGFPGSGGYWVAAFLFGAILPSLVALMMVLPLKGQPMGGGWHPPLLLTAFLINGVWGIGTGLILKALTSWFSGSRNVTGMIL